MALMDLIGKFLGRSGPKSGNPLMDTLLPMLTKGGGSLGGLGGLLGKFNSAGLGGKAESWVGNGDNEPLDAAEVEQALGGDLDDIASQAGVSREEASSGLAGMLPGLIDQLSPGGKVPGGGLGKIAKGLDLGKILGR